MSKKTEAIKLRMRGHTYKEISGALGGVPKSTLSSWLSDVPVSGRAKKRLARIRRTRQAEWARKGSQAMARKSREHRASLLKGAQNQIDGLRLTVGTAALVGAALYWAEGDKARNMLRFTNSDVVMMKFMRRWFVEILNVPPSDLRCAVHVYLNNGLTYDEIESWWSKALGIPRVYFYAPQLNKAPKSKKNKRTRKLLYGTITLSILCPQKYRARYFALLSKLGADDSIFVEVG